MKKITLYIKLGIGLLITQIFSMGVYAVGLGLMQKYFHIENNFYDGIHAEATQLNCYNYLIFVVFLGPIFEEIIFRNSLKKFRYKELIFSVGVYFFYIAQSKLTFIKTIDFAYINYTELIVGTAIMGISFLFGNGSIENEKIKIFLIIVINFFFGIAHFKPLLLNGEWNIVFILNGLFTIFPFFASGLFYTYLRKKYSLSMSIIYHIITNFLPFLSLYILK